MRIYLARIPEFNAVMFPSGFTVIFSGLLLRARNEAQLAGVMSGMLYQMVGALEALRAQRS